MSQQKDFFLSRRATRLRRGRLKRARFWRWLLILLFCLATLAGVLFWQQERLNFVVPEKKAETPLAPSLLRNSKEGSAALLPPLPAPNGAKIIVHIPSRTLDFYRDGKLLKTYQIAVGRIENQTPVGVFTVFQKEVNPWWYPPKGSQPVPSGPQNPLGYRWIGFAPMYGIHGTNAPWQIGGVVSNGCVRMRETDVEELFAQVEYGTPVRIVYELAKVNVDAEGLVTAGVYQDVYRLRGRAANSQDLERQLAGLGLTGFLAEAQLTAVLKDGRGWQLPVARLHNLKVNGRLLEAKGVSLQGEIWLPAWSLAAGLGHNLRYEAATMTVFSNGNRGNAVVKGGVVYVTMKTARELWGGMWLWRKAENVWELAAPGLGS